MSVITIFSGSFCQKAPIVKNLVEDTGYKLISDKEVVSDASRLSGIAETKIERAFTARTSVFNKFTHEREHSIAYLRLALAQILSVDQLVISGFSGQLIPKEVSHALRVCIIADMKSRISAAVREEGLTENEAIKLLRKQDEDCASWALISHNLNDPWDPSMYDIIMPSDKMTAKEAADIIKENLVKDAVQPTDDSKKAVGDFLLASRVEVALVLEGHNVGVTAKDARVTITINKHVLMLGRLEEELKSIAEKISGVRSIETKVGPDFHKTDIYRRYDFEMPSKILLVDDEREFVQTLSERLLMRDMGSAVAYDGQSALDLVKDDEPDVMILDLKMPGIDGIEVLRRVKETQPEIEVIILTGHGSEADKEVCMSLGAFAYLQKPVDISLLSDTIKKANEKIKEKRGG
jgi:CheY-like chemotaxis protein/cytidylate kinase